MSINSFGVRTPILDFHFRFIPLFIYGRAAITHLSTTLEVMGSSPCSCGDISEIRFLASIVSGTVGLKMVCVTLQELTVTRNVSGD